MKGYEILTTYLNSVERDKFMTNINHVKTYRGAHNLIYVQDWGNGWDMIQKSFAWNESVEGTQYWLDIYYRLYGGHDTLSPKKKLLQHSL